MATCRRLFICLLLGGLCVPAFAQQERGDKEIALSGSLTIPHVTPGENVLGLVNPRFGYYLTKRNFIGLDVTSLLAKGFQAHDFSFLYRFYFSTSNPKFYPFLGLAPGSVLSREPSTREFTITDNSIATVQNQIARLPAAQQFVALSSLEAALTQFDRSHPPQEIKKWVRNTAGKFQFGFKSFLSQKFAFEVSYNLLYRDLKFAAPDVQYSDVVLQPNNTVAVRPAAAQNIPKQPSMKFGFKERSFSALIFGFSYIF